ncbi:helix-turn-helix transcriptional regulator [Mycolicibacillus parakoreensis]|uniref:Metalloregulator ArsR/SmtB family transcription factor n=1 Tax=Mycolicibacillus parakoreensis TaxID=1069221 RepID=A0ABY3U5X8_9MYCO|nr:metalloregulator ArsR/SmtB family transcription factor [Mycolicibacillus parakoreensis]MCV7313957.1 helix-turn-helix transcriptional regulator [Mycolicibacillus parakoreensis]ULN54172.1 metalloregulator ArsR/SmtB family transcription factor [Mycolicibacillus parakoreensis]
MTTSAFTARDQTEQDLQACCQPITDTVLDPGAAERLAELLKALAEPTRLRLVSLIAGHEGAEACVCDLTAPVGLSQPTVSHHLKILVEAGLLDRTQRGRWAYYRVVPAALEALARSFARGADRTHGAPH